MDIRYVAANYVRNMFNDKFSRRVGFTRAYEKNKVKQNTVMYESFFGTNISDNPLAIFKYILAHDSEKKFNHIWVLDDVGENGYKDYYSKLSNVHFVKPNTKEYYNALTSSQFIVYNVTLPPYFIKQSGQTVLNTWHGTPLKTLGSEMEGDITQNYNVQRNFLACDYLLAPNDFTMDKLINSYGINGIYQGQVLKSGYPRIDQIYGADSPVRDAVLADLKIDPHKKLVLYAPTWRGITGTVDNTVNDVAQRIAAIAKRVDTTKYQIIAKVHPQMAQFMADSSIEGVTFVPAWLDASELLAKVDMLITDYSSIFFDYLVTDKPIIFYMYDRAEYMKSRGVYFDLDDLPGEDCTSVDQVVHAIENSGDILTKHAATIQRFKKDFVPHDDGHVTERVVNVVWHNQTDQVESQTFSNGKKNVVAYGGGMLNNGITSSLVNLSHNFDYDQYNLIIYDKNNFDDDTVGNIKRFDKRAHVLFRGDGIDLTYPEWIVYNRLFNRQQVADVEKHKVFVRREWHRLLGMTPMDVALDFSGYNPFWTYLMAFSDASRKIIFQHNDMSAELSKNVLGENVHLHNLSTIFNLYKYFDYIACVGKFTLALNRKNLVKYTRDDQFKLVQNTLDTNELFAHRHKPVVKETEIFGHKQLVLESVRSYGFLSVEAIRSFSRSGKNFINIGRLSPEKGQDRLLKAFKRLLTETGTDHQLYIVGSGPDEADLKLLTSQLELEDHVVFVGQTPHALELLDNSDCFVFSSRHEGQPMTLLECLALKKPIVATKIPGNLSVLEGTNATIVPDSEEGILAGMKAYLAGDVSASDFDVDTYNHSAMAQFNAMLK